MHKRYERPPSLGSIFALCFVRQVYEIYRIAIFIIKLIGITTIHLFSVKRISSIESGIFRSLLYSLKV